MAVKLTTADFIKKATAVHGKDRYCYDCVIYVGNRDKVKIICPLHGMFEQSAGQHLRGAGCIRCRDKMLSESRKGSFEVFLEKARKAHSSGKYEYRQESYSGQAHFTDIYCTDCKLWFSQRAYAHTSKGQGCPHCCVKRMKESKTRSFEDFVILAASVHKNKFIYKNSYNYKNSRSKVEIFCPMCSKSYDQVAVDHTRGAGCHRCSGTHKRTNEEFVEDCKRAHEGKFSYENTLFKTRTDKVEIFCKTCNRYFIRTAGNILDGGGCPLCTPTGYRKEKQGTLYILQNESTTKIGITNRPVMERVKQINQSSGKNFTPVFQIKFTNGAIPQNIERNLLSYLRLNYQPVEECYDGSTECFLNVNYDDLLLHVRHEHLKQLKEHYGN